MRKTQKNLLSVRLLWVFLFFSPVFSKAQDTSASINPPPVSEVASAPEESPKYILCRSGKSVRTVRVQEDAGSCATFYTKGGVDKKVGGSKDVLVCLNVLKSIRKNLEIASWKCKDISASSVSESPSVGQ